MCDICNGMTQDEALEKTVRTVARYGWQLVMVSGTATEPAFGYTVGLTELQHPEILVTGRCQDDTVALINELVDMVRGHGHTLMAGMVLPLEARDVYLAPVERPEGVVLTAVSLYGPRATALQAVWADDDGWLPWEHEVPDTLTQPLYGTPPGL